MKNKAGILCVGVAVIGMGTTLLTGCGEITAGVGDPPVSKGPDCPTSTSQSYSYDQVKKMTDGRVGCVKDKTGPITVADKILGGKCPDGAWFAKQEHEGKIIYVLVKPGQNAHPVVVPTDDQQAMSLTAKCTSS